MPYPRDPTISRKVCSVRSGSRGSSRASVKARVGPMRWSNCRMGSSPASLESRPGAGSITSGVPKKARHWGQTGSTLSVCLRAREQATLPAYLDEDGRHVVYLDVLGPLADLVQEGRNDFVRWVVAVCP